MLGEKYEELYLSLFRANRDAVIFLNKSIIVEANQAALDLVELTRDEFIGKDIKLFSVNPELTAERIKERLQGISGFYTTTMKTGGTIKEIEVSSTPLVTNGVTSYSIIRDVTQKNQYERRYRTIFERTADLIIVTDDSSVVFINPSGLKFLGLSSRDEILGKSILNFLHPDSRVLASEFSALRRSGQAPPSKYRVKMLRKDGHVLDVEFNASFIDWEGTPSSLTIARDIGEQVRLEAQLRQSEAVQNGILDTIPDTITLKDLDYNLIWVNKSEKESLGLSDEEIRGEKCYKIGFNRDTPCEHCGIPEVERTGRGTKFIKEFPNGTFFDISVEPIYDEQGKITSYLETARDITQQKLFEKEIIENRERLSGFIEAATDGFSILDSDMHYIMVNDAELRFTGRRREEYVGRHILDVFPGLKDSDRYQGYLNVMKTGEPIEYRSANIRPELNMIVDFSAFKAGDLLGIVAKDVTQQIRYQRRLEALHRHANQLALFKFKDEISDSTMKIIRETLGFKIGSFGFVENDRLVFTAFRKESTITELDLNGTGITIRAVATGETQHVVDTRKDPDYISGRQGDEETLSELDVPVLVDGQVVALINLESNEVNGFSLDDKRIVETLAAYVASALHRINFEFRLTALHEFALSLNKLDSIELIAQETIKTVERVFNIPFTSFGIVRDGALWFPYSRGFNLSEGYHLDLSGNGVTVRTIKTGETQVVWDVTKDPDYILPDTYDPETNELVKPICEVVVPVFEYDRPVGVINMESDRPKSITQDSIQLLELLGEHVSARLTALQYESEHLRAEQAEEMERLKARFVSTATHELKTPLTIMKGFIELAQGEEDKEKIKSYLEVAARNTNRLEKLISDLLDQQRIEEGRVDVDLQPLDLGALVSYALEEVSGLIKKKNQNVVIQLPESPVIVLGDELRLGQVLVNLVDNASKYSQPGSEILVSVKETPESVKVSVEDQGIGIRPEDIALLFTPFPNIDTPVVSEPSVGLGLSICKGFIELHGGEIWVETEGLGKGSTFSFTLPVKK